MKQAPYLENYQGLELHIHNLAFTNSFWSMFSTNEMEGTAFTKVWVHHAEYTNLIGSRGLTISFTVIVRNQSDNSNVVIVIGSITAKCIGIEKTSRRTLLLVSEFIFSKAEEYVKENNLKGKDEKDFIFPPFLYVDSQFEKFVKELE